MKRELKIFDNLNDISDFAVKKWTELSEKAIKDSDRFSVALSGGKTPVTLYRKLSKVQDLPWNKTDIFIVDERFVPPESDDSNFRMIREVLLDHISIPAENIHSVTTLNISLHDAALQYEREIRISFGISDDAVPSFDLILLGIGDDGHTASLFPAGSELNELNRLILSVNPPDITRSERISMTFRLINNAKNIIFLSTGADKSIVIKEVIEDRNSTLPAALVNPRKGDLIFLFDNEAASLLATQ